MISSNFTWSFQPFQKIYLSYRLLIGLNREGSSHRQRFCFLGGIVWDFEGVSRWNTCNVLGGSGDLRPQKIINFRESSFNMTRGGWRYWGGAPKIFRHLKGGLWKSCCARRGGSENLYTSKATHDIIVQVGWFSTQQFNDLCNSAISRGLQI